MKHFSKLVQLPYFKIGLSCYLALILCSVQPAEAAVISASAVIDWSTFKITPIDIGQGLPTLTWNNQNDSGYAGNCCSGISENASNWSTGTLATASAATSSSSSSASASTSANQIKADTSINGTFPYQSLYFNSHSQRSGNFTVQGSGLFLFQANYSLAEDAGTGSNASANSSVSFYLNSTNGGGGGGGGVVGQTFNRYLNSGSLPIAESGILAVALAFNDGWTGNFSAGTSTSVSSYDYGGGGSVPLPAAFWLFGSALLGVASLRLPNSNRLMKPLAR